MRSWNMFVFLRDDSTEKQSLKTQEIDDVIPGRKGKRRGEQDGGSRRPWGTSLSMDTSQGMHLQTRQCMQDTSWEWKGRT